MSSATLEIVPLPMEEYLEYVGSDNIRVKGHRIGLEHIVERYQEGYSPEQIVLDFPGLDFEQVYGIIAYYLHNEEDVHAYIERVNARAEHAYQQWVANPSPATRRVQEIRARRRQEHSS